MPVDEELRPLLEETERSASDSYRTIGPEQARRVVAAQLEGLEEKAERPTGVAVLDATVPGPVDPVPVRLYTPESDPGRPCIVFVHGGAWTYGSISTHDGIAGRLSMRTHATVVSVGYSLSPEAPFPRALDEVLAAVEWARERAEELGIDPARLAVAGDSAGGNLAAASTLRAREEKGPEIHAQLLFYPQTDATLSQPSIYELSDGYMLDRDTILWGAEQYVADEAARSDPLVSPLLADDLSGLPRALIVTAEYDPLRDEGEAYARRLRDCGGLVIDVREPGLLHGFLGFTGISRACGDAERRAFESARVLIG